jgi:hypothetical protein
MLKVNVLLALLVSRQNRGPSSDRPSLYIVQNSRFRALFLLRFYRPQLRMESALENPPSLGDEILLIAKLITVNFTCFKTIAGP